MQRFFIHGVVILAAGFVLGGSRSAEASLLTAGSLLIPAPAEPDPVGGAPIAGGAPVPFAAGTFSGTLTSTVITGDPSNLLGGLTFTYLITNDPGSSNPITRLTVNGFGSSFTDASFQVPPGGVIPGFIDRPVADVVGFNFQVPPIGFGRIESGQAGALLVIQTNSLTYLPTTASIIDGSVASVTSFAPMPEPASLLMGSFGLVFLTRWRRARR